MNKPKNKGIMLSEDNKIEMIEMSINNCTIFPIYLCTVFSVYFFNLDSADAVLYEFPKILTILE